MVFFWPSIERNVYNGLKGQRPTNNQKEYKKPRPTRQRKNRKHLPYKYRKRGSNPKQTNNHPKTDQPKHKPTTRAEKKQPKTPPTARAKATKDPTESSPQPGIRTANHKDDPPGPRILRGKDHLSHINREKSEFCTRIVLLK